MTSSYFHLVALMTIIMPHPMTNLITYGATKKRRSNTFHMVGLMILILSITSISSFNKTTVTANCATMKEKWKINRLFLS
jgi:threonine/homoserine/homoserine lactone efflux protein